MLAWQSERPHEGAEIVGQGVKLEPDGVVAEPAARQPRSPDGVLAFLNILLRFLPRAPLFSSPLSMPKPLPAPTFLAWGKIWNCKNRPDHGLFSCYFRAVLDSLFGGFVIL